MTGQEVVQRTPQQRLALTLRSDGHLQQFAAALDGSGISPEKFVRAALTASLEKPELAEADQTTLLAALLRCAQIGLLPDNRQAAINVYRSKVKVNGQDTWIQKAQLLVMIGGVKAIAAEYGWMIDCRAVYEGDHFEYTDQPPSLQHREARAGAERGQLVYAYAVATHKDGRRMQRVLDQEDIAKRRAQAKTQNVWNEWPQQMWEKSAGHEIFDDLPLDPKDRERVERVLAAAGEDGVTLLYGAEDSPVEESAGEGQQAGGSGTDLPAPGSEDVPFEGEEPPPVSEENEPPSEEPTFSTGRYSGLTLAEVYASGKDGLSYCRWAFAAWKTQPLRGALDRFAEEHPDLKP